MPNVLLYEFLTGGGLLAVGNEPQNESLLREGAAMIAALAADFAAIDGVRTTVVLDSRHEIHLLPWTQCRILPVREAGSDCAVLEKNAGDADWTVLIAPEFDVLLESRSRIVQSGGGRLLGPSPRLIALTADKQRTADHLAAAGVPVAFGIAVDGSEMLRVAGEIGFPVVFKPRDGAGSKEFDCSRIATTRSNGFKMKTTFPGVLSRYHPGIAASVAVLCGPEGQFPLPACRQHLSDDGRFRYLGGSCPLEPLLARRATSLAVRAIRSLPDPLGYIGVDLVLGDVPNGRHDVVIEINPRLTTSYVGLRAVAKTNLAAAMLAIAEGQQPDLAFSDRIVQFDADGRCCSLANLIIVAREQVAVAFVAARVEAAVGHGVFHGAAGFVRVRAVGKFAAAYIGPQIAHPAANLFRHHVPKLKLPNARRVDDITAGRQRNQFGGRGRVPTFLRFGADRGNAQVQFRLDRVQQRGFSDAALPNDDARSPTDYAAQPLDTKSARRGDQ